MNRTHRLIRALAAHGWAALAACGVLAAAEGIVTTPEIGSYSPPEFELKWSESPECESATFTVFQRDVSQGGLTAWRSFEHSTGVSSRSATAAGEHRSTHQFRVSAQCGADQERLMLADFDSMPELLKARLTSSVRGVKMSQSFRIAPQAEGEACATFEFSPVQRAESTKDDLVGIAFNKTIPTLDWSSYRYLELYCSTNVPQGLNLNIVSASSEAPEAATAELVSSHDFFSTGGKVREQWQELVVDLDEALGPPEMRRSIRRFSLTVPVQDLEFEKPYYVHLDGVRLWRDRRIVETEIDATPPSEPAQLEQKRDYGKVTWSWQPSLDHESDIAGYAWSWSQRFADEPPDEVMTTNSTVDAPMSVVTSYKTYYFKVKAMNGAGLWSETVTVRSDFKPDFTPPTVPTLRPNPGESNGNL